MPENIEDDIVYQVSKTMDNYIEFGRGKVISGNEIIVKLPQDGSYRKFILGGYKNPLQAGIKKVTIGSQTFNSCEEFLRYNIEGQIDRVDEKYATKTLAIFGISEINGKDITGLATTDELTFVNHGVLTDFADYDENFKYVNASPNTSKDFEMMFEKYKDRPTVTER